jgi:foldase protein PrsA
MFPSEKDFQEALKKQNMDEKDLEKNVRQNLLLERVKAKVVGEVKITETQAKEEYNKNKEKYKVGDQVKVAHILVKDEATAKKVKEELDKGGDFAELAKKYSTDTGNKDKGGELGWVTKEQVVPEFGNAAFALKKGEISNPVKSQFGYHIIKLEDTKKAHIKTFKEVKDMIISQLTEEKKSKIFNSWLEDVRKKSKITKKI